MIFLKAEVKNKVIDWETIEFKQCDTMELK